MSSPMSHHKTKESARAKKNLWHKKGWTGLSIIKKGDEYIVYSEGYKKRNK